MEKDGPNGHCPVFCKTEMHIIKSFESLNKRGRIGFGKYTASQIVPDDDDDDEGEVDLAEEADDDDEESL